MPAPPRGVYIHGPVGSGKTMLLDLLIAQLRRRGLSGALKRVHYNAAILQATQLMHRAEMEGAASSQGAARGTAGAVVPGSSAGGVGDCPGAREGPGGEGREARATLRSFLEWDESRARSPRLARECCRSAALRGP